MAAVDKIYGSNLQYDIFYDWCLHNRPGLLKSFYPKNGYMYTNDRPITNFSIQDDMWLLAKCDLAWVVDRIKEQYSLEE